MSMVQQAIEVGAPLHTVYEQLATFENYPRFMHGVERVTRTGTDQTHWIMDLDGHRREFDATITERSPDERLSWATTDGPLLAETLTLRPIGETRTQVVAQLEADAAFLLPSDRHGQETLNRRLKSDLDTFKSLCENGKFGSRLDTGASSKQLSGRSSTIFGSGPQDDPASPARVRAGRPNVNPGGGWGTSTLDDNPEIRSGGPETARLGTANMGQNVDITSAPGIKDAHDLDDVLPPGRRIGGPDSIRGGATASMGGQAMSPNDNWGDGMINEEDRGSA
jgi:uncharacterized protein YndB with AHSA1/START domain